MTRYSRFYRTYEGLKHRNSHAGNMTCRGFYRTYEGLKRRYWCSRNVPSIACFYRTYEELKGFVVPFAKD